MNRKILPVFAIAVFFSVLTTCPAVGEGQTISLDEAKEIAENYIALLQGSEYQKAQAVVFQNAANPALRDMNVLSKECFFEEFGHIDRYSYKEFGPTAYDDLVLRYEVTYDTFVMDKDITIGERNGVFRIVHTSDDIASSPAAAQKMIRVMKRISERTGASN